MTTGHAQRIVVVGASLGGLRAAEQLRAAGFSGELVVIGDEAVMPYNRPPLSKEALKGEVTFESVAFRLKKTLDDVAWRLGSPATAASLDDRIVVLADGSEIGFDGLVAATGIRPRRLPVPGPTDGRHVVRTIADSTALREALLRQARVVVVGAGFIGCEVAATATELGCSVDVVGIEDTPMQRPLGTELGRAMQRRHERHGVRFHLGRTVSRYIGESSATGVQLDDGSQLDADVLVEAIGCRPNTEWLDGNGLDLSDGVLCDAWMRAEGRADVVAVGDVARFPNTLFDEVPRRVEHWNIPTETAKCAAPTLVAGLRREDPPVAPFAAMPSFWSDQYGARLQSFGAPLLADSSRLLHGDLDDEGVVGYYSGDALVGVVGIGCMKQLMAYRAEIAGAARRLPA